MPRIGACAILLVFLLAASGPQAKTSGTGARLAGTKGATVPAGDLVDINRAGADELKRLPGIEDAYAAAIIRNRPYKNKTQLITRKVIPGAAYRKIRDRIIAKQ